MQLGAIYEYLDEISPFELQEKWDNSGILVGAKDQEIKRIVLALDVTLELAEEHEEDTLFLVHHPLIFSPLKQMDFDYYPANIMRRLIQKNQSVIAMHTNIDKTHLNRYVFERVLGLRIDKEAEFMLQDTRRFATKELYALLGRKLGLDNFKVVNEKPELSGVALTTGSGSSMMDMCETDCFLTGDIKYHEAMKAQQQDLMLVDIGHYESEKFFADALSSDLKNLDISVIISNSKNPFKTVAL